MSLLFILPLLSGFWSADKNEWLAILRIKLPLLFLPLAFAGPLNFSRKQWEYLGYVFIGLVTGAACLSIFHYLSNWAFVNESYLKAKSIITPLENDHVRFSWLVSTTILLAGWLFTLNIKENKLVAWFLAGIAVWLIIFLHILAARTGLISFYIIAAGTGIWLMTIRMKRKYGQLILIVVITLPIISYKVIPTFQNRVTYFLYDKGYFEKTHYLPGATDAVRIISIKAGWGILKNNPLIGVGSGDVQQSANQWYAENYPEMLETDKIRPSSEWLMYGVAYGLPGFLLFSMAMLIPFLVKTGYKLIWWLLNATSAFSFLFDIGLEVQFGVFIYSFILLWWWKWMTTEKF